MCPSFFLAPKNAKHSSPEKEKAFLQIHHKFGEEKEKKNSWDKHWFSIC
jgi:hypothetical protein